jgi:cytochrome c oxidase subunit 2
VKPGEKVLVHVLANDVIHGFQIPAVRFMTEVDPGAVRSIWFRAPKKAGKYLIQCVNYCGVGHYQMKAWLVVKGDGDEKEEEKGHGEKEEKHG